MDLITRYKRKLVLQTNYPALIKPQANTIKELFKTVIIYCPEYEAFVWKFGL